MKTKCGSILEAKTQRRRCFTGKLSQRPFDYLKFALTENRISQEEYENEKKNIFNITDVMYVPNALAGNGFCGTDKDVVRNTERGRRSGRLKLGQCLAEPGKRDE
jgi:hypothetical protein